ncbi:MAG: peptidoglycan-N-acetylglucosamine deacetylase [Verrucomicrobiota bacterium]
MTRFHIVAIIAATFASLGLALNQTWLCIAAVLVVLLLVGLGSAIPQMSFFGPFICRGTNSQRHVALTFDDGPDPRSTPALLELLREASVKTAFFGIGHKVSAQPDLAARIVREGHLLENHSYEHTHTMNIATSARLAAELARTQSAIEQATGVAPRLYRPPIGLSNPRVFRVTRALGLTLVGWSAGGLDTRLTDPARIVARILRRIKPGAIILLHDGNIPRERLLATVKMLLERLSALGYQVVRLDQLLNTSLERSDPIPA